MRCLAGDPHEADPFKRPREAGPASDPHEAGHATLGEGRISEDGVVVQVNVGDVEVDELGTVVFALPEGDREADLPYRGSGAVSNS